jgi:hypothetical protein
VTDSGAVARISFFPLDSRIRPGHTERMISQHRALECPVCGGHGRHRCPGGTYLKFSAGELVPVTLPAKDITPWPHMMPVGTSLELARALFRDRLIQSCPR